MRIDVGLSLNAPQSQVWIDKDPNCFVFGFEPVTANIENIKTGISPWPINLDPSNINKKMYILPCALLDVTNEDGMEIFVTKKDPGCSSLLKPKTFEIDYIEKVSVYTLNDFFDYFPFEHIQYISHLKIDVQGADIQVIEGTTKYLDQIMAITLEVDTSEYSNSRNSLKDIQVLLAKYGFVLIRNNLWGKIKLLLKGVKIECKTDDPSFINLPLYKKYRPQDFWIYQRG